MLAVPAWVANQLSKRQGQCLGQENLQLFEHTHASLYYGKRSVGQKLIDHANRVLWQQFLPKLFPFTAVGLLLQLY